MNQAIHLLWTGGWDSTYRLLDALVTKNKVVQPHYVRDTSAARPATLKELETMDKIRALIAERFPHLAKRLLPTLVTERSSLTPRDELRKHFLQLRKKAYLGAQYKWLSEYALSRSVPLELSVHIDDKAHWFIKDDVRQVSEGNDHYFVLVERPSDSNLAFFSPFRFPILMMTKLEMQEQAERSGTSDLLEASWFCHRPVNGKPCGTCPPCQYTIEEGLGRRIPLRGRVLYQVKKPYFVLRRSLSRLKYHF